MYFNLKNSTKKILIALLPAPFFIARRLTITYLPFYFIYRTTNNVLLYDIWRLGVSSRNLRSFQRSRLRDQSLLFLKPQILVIVIFVLWLNNWRPTITHLQTNSNRKLRSFWRFILFSSREYLSVSNTLILIQSFLALWLITRRPIITNLHLVFVRKIGFYNRKRA